MTACFDEAAAYRQKFESDWKEYEGSYDGKHWEQGAKRPYLNYMFSTIEYEVPILTDSRPGTDVISLEEDPEKEDTAKTLKEAIDYVYRYNHLDIRLAQGVRECLKSTNHYLYVDYDPDIENGDGQITITNKNWRTAYLDPSSDDLDEMSYVGFKFPMKVDVVKRRFPDKADLIKPEDVEIDDTTQADSMFLIENRYHGPNTKTVGVKFSPMDMVYFRELWRRDYSTVPIAEEETLQYCEEEWNNLLNGQPPDVTKFQDHATIIQLLQQKFQEWSQEHMAMNQPGLMQDEMGNVVQPPNPAEGDVMMIQQMVEDAIQQHQVMLEQNPNGEKPKYPGNLRLTIAVGDVLVYDGPSPVEDGKYPIAPIYCYKNAGQPYSTGEIKNILPVQKVIDELLWHEYEGLRLCTNPGWIYDDNANVDSNSLVNKPGIKIKKRPGTEVRRLEPGQVSPQLQNKQLVLKEALQEISGITEVAQGKRPTGISAASAITALQEQSIGRIRLKSRSLEEYTLLRLGELVAARIVKYWTKDKILKVYDDNGRIKSIQVDPNRLEDLKYVVRMSPGSTFDLNKESILDISKELLTNQIIDPETFMMMNPDLPYRTQIIQRLQERDQMNNQLQMLAQENELLKQQLTQLGVDTQGPSVNGQPPEAMPTQ